MRKLSMRAVPAALLLAFSGATWAAGFAVSTQNVSGLGTSYAGAAAVAEDASTTYYNPAGLIDIKGTQVVAGGNVVAISTKFANGASLAATAVPLGGTGGNAGGVKLIPFGYFAMDVTPAVKFGLGIGAPFGNATEWDGDWLGRFQGTTSELRTININPSLAFRVNDSLSVGAGINYQLGDAEFRQGVNGFAAIFGATLAATGSAAAAAAAATPFAGTEAEAKFKVDDNAWGWNLGLMLRATEATRIGAAYRSKIKYKMTGDVSYTSASAALNAALAGSNGAVNVDLTMPDSFSLSLAHRLNARWEVLGDLTWTGWSVWQQLKPIKSSTGATITDVPYKWKDVWRVGVGGVYAYNEATRIKLGFAYDQSPANDTYRTVTLPDSDRYWLSLGVKYTLSKAGQLDLGYAHEFIRDASINNNYGGPSGGASTAAFGLAQGTAKKHIDIVGVQYTHNF